MIVPTWWPKRPTPADVLAVLDTLDGNVWVACDRGEQWAEACAADAHASGLAHSRGWSDLSALCRGYRAGHRRAGRMVSEHFRARSADARGPSRLMGGGSDRRACEARQRRSIVADVCEELVRQWETP